VEAIKPIAVTIPTATAISGLSRTKIYRLIGDGRLDAIRIDGRRLVRFESIERLLSPSERQEAEG
jgi:excisionase family DNA binding protein